VPMAAVIRDGTTLSTPCFTWSLCSGLAKSCIISTRKLEICISGSHQRARKGTLLAVLRLMPLVASRHILHQHHKKTGHMFYRLSSPGTQGHSPHHALPKLSLCALSPLTPSPGEDWKSVSSAVFEGHAKTLSRIIPCWIVA